MGREPPPLPSRPGPPASPSAPAPSPAGPRTGTPRTRQAATATRARRSRSTGRTGERQRPGSRSRPKARSCRFVSPAADHPLGVLLLLVVVIVDAAGLDLVGSLVGDEQLPELDVAVEVEPRRLAPGCALIHVRVHSVTDITGDDELAALGGRVADHADPLGDRDDHLTEPLVRGDVDRLSLRPGQLPQ